MPEPTHMRLRAHPRRRAMADRAEMLVANVSEKLKVPVNSVMTCCGLAYLPGAAAASSSTM